MTAPALTHLLRLDYESKYGIAYLHGDRVPTAHKIIQRIMYGQHRYEKVSAKTGIPWYVIAVIHQMECDGDFTCHLHNGDPLTARTVDVPRGRPVDGNPPFEWEASAVDAINYERTEASWKPLSDADWFDWGVGATLYKLEAYNGWGYREHHINDPYLWGGTELYSRGKYVKDGVWNGYAVSEQIGTAILLKLMAKENAIEFPPKDRVTPTCEVQ